MVLSVAHVTKTAVRWLLVRTGVVSSLGCFYGLPAFVCRYKIPSEHLFSWPPACIFWKGSAEQDPGACGRLPW